MQRFKESGFFNKLLKLYAVTRNKNYLQAALRIAATLQKLQQRDGSWPYRINPTTGAIQHGYTSSQLWYVWFYEQLAAVTEDSTYLKQHDKAFQWLLENPVKTNEWLGLYGDVASEAPSYDQRVPSELAMYLIDHRAENPHYIDLAEGILDWINRTMVVYPGFHPGIPGLLEQSLYLVVLTHHELRLAELYAKLWEATGNKSYRNMAEQIANSVTWCLTSDGKLWLGLGYHASATATILSYNDQFTRIMAALPETAPPEENHLLQVSNLLQQVEYGRHDVSYRTMGRSFDVLTLVGRPQSVHKSGESLAEQSSLLRGQHGWRYDPLTRELQVSHSLPDVTIAF